MNKYLLVAGTFILLFVEISVLGQNFYRIESDISIKTKEQGGKGSLTMGRVYYDKTIGKLVYDITFPEREIWVVSDSLSMIYRNGSLYQRTVINPFVETTLFHKSLEGKLIDFGLSDTPYTIEKVERDGNLVITTWEPPPRSDNLGKIITSTIRNSLHGVAIKNSSGDILSKQIFENYKMVSGLMVPSEIIQVMYQSGSEVYQVITLSDIAVNSIENENMYNYSGGSY